MEISIKSFTTCEVTDDGEAIALQFEDAAGHPGTIRVSLNQAGSLIMTLPGLVEKALHLRYGDRSLRYSYPLASWIIEQSTDATQRIMTLEAAGGFSVRFSIPKAEQSVLGEALMTQFATEGTVLAN